MEIPDSVYIFCLKERILYRNYQTEPKSETSNQMLVPWESASHVLELLHGSPSADHFGTEKKCKKLLKSFISRA